MIRILLILALLQFAKTGTGQEDFLVVKKRNRSVQYYWAGSHITFQLRDGQWLAGTITRISRDSFSFTKEIVRQSLMGFDTLRMSGYAFSLADVRALPTRREITVYENDQARVILGREKFVWIRNGFLLQAAGAGYAGLLVVNSLYNQEPPFGHQNLGKLGAAAAVYMAGQILHWRFTPYLTIGRKYRLQVIDLEPGKAIPGGKP